MLKLPDLQKLNLKCSAWIMSRVSVSHREIQLREHKIFLLDNLDLGIFNKPHNVLPRISVFDGDLLRRMLTMTVDPIKGATSYSHANNQLVGKDIPYDITSSQMFFLPVPLEDGWILLMWDMMSRKLHVLDPLIRRGITNEATKDKHEMIAWKLHHALFRCLNEYYAG
ncbi:hypothetical protein D1007_23729 [Hordeum vulgare]|nr:hypothetical protein D1007_23729 [Hordeum vulgare]